MTKRDEEIAQQIGEKILAQDGQRIRRVILYGSRAQGTASADSDFDFLVVERDPASKRDEMLRLRRALCDIPYPVDIWVMGEQEFQETKNVIGGLAYPAHKYGVVLYENP
jgi:predicted nucleotidyltransferase